MFSGWILLCDVFQIKKPFPTQEIMAQKLDKANLLVSYNMTLFKHFYYT